MKTKITSAAIALLFSQSLVFGQKIGDESIDKTKVSPWAAKHFSEYQSVYHFGFSEGESDMVLIFGLGKNYAQIRSSSFSADGQMVRTYKNLTNVKVEKNKFFSDQTKGEFVVYSGGESKIQGLKVLTPWSGVTEKGEYEIGPKSYPVADYFSGKFTQASTRQVTNAELAKLSKQDLKLMRNEIYARYGFIFKPGGEMEAYFKKQEWYSAQHANVDAFFTDLEKENIKTIQALEGK